MEVPFRHYVRVPQHPKDLPISMAVFRIHARLDVKPPNLVKGIQLEGLRVVGSPTEYAVKYYEAGADEILVQDVVASLYGKPSQFALVSEIATGTFVPMTVAGGIRTVDDAIRLVAHGADKVGINTAAITRPKLISEIAEELGSQAVVAVIEAKRHGRDEWEVFTDGGRERTGLDVSTWISQLSDFGAGEIVVVSIDSDGLRKGPDLYLAGMARELTDLPLIYQGGVAETHDVKQLAELGFQGVAIGASLHGGQVLLGQLKSELSSLGVEVRI